MVTIDQRIRSSGTSALALAASSGHVEDVLTAAAQRVGLDVRDLGSDPRLAVGLSQPQTAFRAAGGYLAAAMQLGAVIRLAGPTPIWFCGLDPELTGRSWSLVDAAGADALVRHGTHLVKLADGKHPAFPARRFIDPDDLAEAMRRVHAGAGSEFLATSTWLPIHSEYRVFTAGRDVLTYSPYLVEDDPWTPLLRTHRASFHEESATYMEGVLQDLNDDRVPPAAVFDVARLDDGRFVILEVNQPWSSGLYGCDADAALTSIIHANSHYAQHHDDQWLWRPDSSIFDLRWHHPHT